MKGKLYLILLFMGLTACVIQRFWLPVASIAVFGTLLLFTHRFPKSRLSLLLGWWFGPYPRPSERQSRYLFRLSGFVLVIVLGLNGLMLAGAYLFGGWLKASEFHPVFMGVFSFGLPILTAMAALGGLLCLVKAAWLKLRGRDSCFLNSDDVPN